ncbi:MAG: O-methyltransferase [Flavobacteriaceae bacterium]|nr:O-methyltransferase [Flavobacteriaceae bacterium]
MDFIPDNIDDYVVKHSQNEPDLLKQLNRETNLKIMQPRMISGHYQGRVLSMISKLVRPLNILEIGTYTGYSALCLAEGMQADGQLHTIDMNEELVDLQKRYFNRSDFGRQIIQHLGDARQIIPKLDLMFDLVFIDADKENYNTYFHLIIDKLNPGGILLSDNVLWSGKVLKPAETGDEATASLIKYNRLLNEDNRIETVILPIRDGLTISRKK